MITANNLIDRFRQFAEAHYFIRTFSFGDPSEIDITKLPEPPLMHVTYLGSRYAPGLKVYSLEVYILDQPPITTAKQEYQQETVSDAEQCAEDILADMEAGHNVFDFEFTVENASATPLRENASGLFAGVLLELEVGVPYNNEACFAPLDGVQPGTDEQVYQRRGLLKVTTENGSVDVPSVNTIRVSNGTLTDNGSGVVTIDTGGGGASTLNELNDVTITNVSANQFLRYDGVARKWRNEPVTIPSPIGTTDQLQEGTTNLYYTDARVEANTAVAANTAKLAGIEAGAEVNVQADWNAASGDAAILNKPTIPGALADLSGTADDIADGQGKVLFTPTERSKLAGIASGAERNVNADWNATSGDAQILNKPQVPDKLNQLTGDSDDISEGTSNLFMTTAERAKLGTMEQGAEVNVNADWNAASGDAAILNKPIFAAVSTSGSYSDLSNKPTIWQPLYGQMRRITNQPINATPAGVTTGITFDRLDIDDLALLNLSAGTFTTNAPGVYIITFSAAIRITVGTVGIRLTARTYLKLNGAKIIGTEAATYVRRQNQIQDYGGGESVTYIFTKTGTATDVISAETYFETPDNVNPYVVQEAIFGYQIHRPL